ncbi:MAG: hypothetical protein ABJQ29_14390 [Luteolibacter sp.]
MTQQKLLLPVAIFTLAVALSIILISRKNRNEANGSNFPAENASTTIPANVNPHERPEVESKLEREDPSAAIARRNLEKEFDELLPAQYPNQFSSLCDVTLEPGESLILGGFKTSDGNYEFTMMTVTPYHAGNGGNQYSIRAQNMTLTPEKSAEMGFDALISPAKTRIQKSHIVNSHDFDPSGDGVSISANPTLVTNANSPASITIGNAEGAHVISTFVTPQGDGESIRLRTRIESPTSLP